MCSGRDRLAAELGPEFLARMGVREGPGGYGDIEEPAERRIIAAEDMGKRAYYGICAGCHAYSTKMIGPPTQIIQALYMDNPAGIAEYAAKPVKKRPDYPEMPPQSHLDEETLLAAAQFMLQVKR